MGAVDNAGSGTVGGTAGEGYVTVNIVVRLLDDFCHCLERCK